MTALAQAYFDGHIDHPAAYAVLLDMRHIDCLPVIAPLDHGVHNRCVRRSPSDLVCGVRAVRVVYWADERIVVLGEPARHKRTDGSVRTDGTNAQASML